MQFYRLEFKDGRGVYHFDESNPREDTRPWLGETDFSSQLLPQKDKLLAQHFKEIEGIEIVKSNDDHMVSTRLSGYSFGFDSPSQLLKWFPKQKLETLAEHTDALVGVYNVPDEFVITGESQCIMPFILQRIIPKKQEPIKTFLSTIA